MTADATLPASDDLTPEVLARWEELATQTRHDDLIVSQALRQAVSGVRSRDARIAELERLAAANHAAYLQAIGAEIRS